VADALEQAHAAGDDVNGQILADEYRRLQALETQKPRVSPNDAGVENIFGDGVIPKAGGYVVRALAQPLYEGLTAANVIAEAPQFIGGELTQLWNSADLYFSDESNKLVNEYNEQAGQQLADAIRAKQAKGEPIPLGWEKALVELADRKGKGISFKQASEWSAQKTQGIVDEYMTSGAITDNVSNGLIDTFVSDPEENKKVKDLFQEAKQSIEDSDIIPSATTAMDESILGNALKGFGWVLHRLSGGLTKIGIPEDTSDAIVNLGSLLAGPKFAKGVKGFKDITGYTDLTKQIYGNAPKNALEAVGVEARLESLLKLSDKKQMEVTLKAKEKALQDPNLKPTDRKLTENELKQAEVELRDTQYNFLGGKKETMAWDSNKFEALDKETFDLFNEQHTFANKKKMVEELTNDNAGLTNFRKWAQIFSRSTNQASKSSGTVMVQRMQNLFGQINGWDKGRKMNDTTRQQYNDVVDFIEGSKRNYQIKWTPQMRTLEKNMRELMKEDIALTKYLQEKGKLEAFELDTTFMPRRFLRQEAGAQGNLIGDVTGLKFGDAPVVRPKSLSERVYFKLTSKKGFPIFITKGKAGENSRQIPVLDKNGKPVHNWRGKPKTREYKYEGPFKGQPTVSINKGREVEGNRIYFQTKPGAKNKKAYVDKNGKEHGINEVSQDGALALKLTEAAKELNEGRGIEKAGDTFVLDGVTYKVENLSRKELADNYAKKVVPDHMSSLIDSINEKRQLQRKIEFEEAWFESAFGKKNSKLIKDIAESDTKGPAYDPKNPNKPGSLKPLRFNAKEAGFDRMSNYYFSKRAGDVIGDNFRVYKQKGILGAISDALVKNMMLNPFPHMHNEVVHYYASLGVTKGSIGKGGGIYNVLFKNKDVATQWTKDTQWAHDMVLNRRPLYMRLIGNGMSSMSMNVINTRTWSNLQEINAKQFKEQSGGQKTYKDSMAYAPWLGFSKGYAKVSEFAQYSMWTSRDVMFMQVVKQKADYMLKQQTKAWEKGGKKGEKPVENDALYDMAVKEVETHMPTYRLPETVGPESVLGYEITRKLSQLLQNPEIVIFSRYKHGMVSSGLNTLRDISASLDPILSRTGKAGKFVSDKLGYKEIQMHRSLKKQVRDGFESGGALAMSLYMLYPMMDALFQVLFDSDEIKFRRAGINHVIEVGGQTFSGEKGMDSLRQVLLTINPALQLAFELMMNTNVYSGQSIVDYNDLLGDGNIEDFGSDLLEKGKQTIPQWSNLMRAEDENEEATLRKWTTGQFDLKTKYGKSLGKKTRDMSRQDLKNLDKAMEEGRAEEYLEEYYKR
jgi:hypothetical protein